MNPSPSHKTHAHGYDDLMHDASDDELDLLLEGLDMTTIFILMLVPLLMVSVGVRCMLYQCQRLSRELHSRTNSDGESLDTASSCQAVTSDLVALRDEYRSSQEQVRKDLKAEMDVLKKLQSDMASQMGEIKTMVEQLAEAQGADFADVVTKGQKSKKND